MKSINIIRNGSISSINKLLKKPSSVLFTMIFVAQVWYSVFVSKPRSVIEVDAGFRAVYVSISLR